MNKGYEIMLRLPDGKQVKKVYNSGSRAYSIECFKKDLTAEVNRDNGLRDPKKFVPVDIHVVSVKKLRRL